MHADSEQPDEVAQPVCQQAIGHRTTDLVEKLRKIPCLGILMAFASGICFATASFTVELMQGNAQECTREAGSPIGAVGCRVDASLVVVGR